MTDYLEITLPLILLSIGGVAFWGLKIYVGKKLENIATSQDIKSMTETVESVKQMFTHQTEELKHSLTVLTNKESALFNEEKDALHVYYSSWQVWYTNLIKKNVNYAPSAIETIDDILKDLDFTKHENEFDTVTITISKLELFLGNENILNLAHILIVKTLELQTIIEKFAKQNIYVRDETNALMRQLKHAQSNKDTPGQKRISDLIKERVKQNQLAYKEFANNKDNKIQEMLLVRGNFIFYSREYLRKGFINKAQ